MKRRGEVRFRHCLNIAWNLAVAFNDHKECQYHGRSLFLLFLRVIFEGECCLIAVNNAGGVECWLNVLEIGGIGFEGGGWIARDMPIKLASSALPLQVLSVLSTTARASFSVTTSMT